MTVQSASRYEQRADELAAAPQVLDAEDIRRFGYRTLAEVLGHFAGVQLQNDGVYTRVGLRGFLSPGDYNARFLLLLDGQRLNEPTYDTAYFGNEAPIDLALVQRVEFIPGPGSSVYGSNALFGVVNVVTRRAADMPSAQLRLRAEQPALAEASAVFTAQAPFGGHVQLGVAQVRERGQRPTAQDLGASSPAGLDGAARMADRTERWYLRWQGARSSVWAAHVDRRKAVYNGQYQSSPEVPGQFSQDTLSLLGARHELELGQGLTAEARLSVGRYRYASRYGYDNGSPQPDTFLDFNDTRWAGAELLATWRWGAGHVLVAGAEAQRAWSIWLGQVQENTATPTLDMRGDQVRLGLFAQNDWRLVADWNTSLGVRLDDNPGQDRVASPRVGLVWQADATTVLKLQGGAAFRAPNAYERLYSASGAGYKTNPDLRAERVKSGELTLERGLAQTLALRSTLFSYRLSDIIEPTVDPLDGLIAPVNLASARVKGVQVEWRHGRRGAFELHASATLQSARDAAGQVLRFAPHRLGKLHAVLPTGAGASLAVDVLVSSGLRGREGGIAGHTIVNLSYGLALLGGQASLGLRNAGDHRHEQPLGDDFLANSLPGPRRSAFVQWQRAL